MLPLDPVHEKLMFVIMNVIISSLLLPTLIFKETKTVTLTVIPGSDVTCGLSLLVLYSAPRGFSAGTPVFPSHQKPTFDLI